MAVDPRIALQKLQSGQALTPDEYTALGMQTPVTPTPQTVTPRSAGIGIDPTAVTTTAATVTPRSAGRVIDDIYPPITLPTPVPANAISTGPTGPVLSTGSTGTTGTTGTKIVTGSTGVTPPPPPPPPVGKKAISSTIQTIGGNSVQIITFDDGTTQQINLGTASSTTNALTLLQSTLSGYGIDPNGSISNAILGLLQKNYDSATIQVLIEDPGSLNSSDPSIKALAQAWQTRFAGNAARLKAGLTPLSPADYINTENAYKAVMARAGLDSAHMDPTKFANLIGTDVSPAEVNQRINAAMTAVTAEDPAVIDQLKQQFNLTTGDLIGHLLDPTTQSSVIANKVSAAQIGAEFERQGITPSAANAYALASMGVTQAQAAQGAMNIASQLPSMQALTARYGYAAPAGAGQALFTSTFGATGGTGLTQAQAEQQLQRLRTQELSAFSGSSGAGKGSLGTAGQEAAGGLQ